MKYKVIFSDRKTLALSVEDGQLIVRAPKKTKKAKIEKVVTEYSEWIEKHLEKSEERAKNHPEPSPKVETELRKLAREILPAKAEHFAEIMGLKYGRVKITSAKKRFGSCSSEGNLCFSFRLMEYPDEAIDYVVVHELAHLVVMNHSKEFYAVIEKVLPDYKKRKKLLKQ